MNTAPPDDTSNSKRLIRDSLVEFLATTVFVYAGTLSALSTGRTLVGQGGSEDVARILPIAMSFGISILALAHSIGHLTGGHMNPGVTFLMFLRRQISATKMACYMFCQFLGALLASSLVWGSTAKLESFGDADSVTRPPFDLGSTTVDGSISTGNAFLLEFMGSFFFYFVIAQTALDKRGIATSMFPAIPIGLILVVVHICLIPFTGCGVNPARTFGPSMVVCMVGDRCSDVVGSWYWIYYVGPFLAAFAVAEVTMLIDTDVEGDQQVSGDMGAKHQKEDTDEENAAPQA
jgi:MIP family channel proteins